VTRHPRIQEVLRRSQELIVQVEKGERDTRGCALTTYASLPGRYLVLMPGSDSSRISRMVESESERKKLKGVISEMVIPKGYALICRGELTKSPLSPLFQMRNLRGICF
jgi:ribonuclease E